MKITNKKLHKFLAKHAENNVVCMTMLEKKDDSTVVEIDGMPVTLSIVLTGDEIRAGGLMYAVVRARNVVEFYSGARYTKLDKTIDRDIVSKPKAQTMSGSLTRF